EDGLPGNECNQGAGMIDSAGRLWIGTVAGAAVYDPKLEVRSRKAPGLIVERILLNGRPISHMPEGLAYDSNNLSFEYLLPSYFRESENSFRTQLVGFEPRPSAWTTDSKREYTNLPEGDYTFRIWGRDYAGNETVPVELSFSIRPAPWRTWWAYMLYLAVIAGIGYAIYRHRLQKLQRKQEERIGYLLKLLESTRAVNSQWGLEQVLEKIAAESARLVDGEPGGIGLVEENKVVFKRVWKQDRWVDTRIEFPLGQGVAGKVAASGKSILVNDPKRDARIIYPELVEEYSVQGFVEVPVFDRSERVVGVLEVRRRPGGSELTDGHRQLIESFAHHAAVAIENANLYGALEEKNLMIVESLKEIEKLYENEQQVNRRLQQLDRMKNNFMAVTSHEMRTPLTVLKGYLETLTEGYFGALTAGQQKRLSICLKTLDRLVGSLNVILEMLRIEEQRLVLKRERVDLCELLQQICDELEVFLEQRHQSFSLDFAEGAVMVDADREKMALVFLNLLQNAIKFTPDGGVIRVRCCRLETGVEVVVEDDGIGLDEEELERIFDKFYTTEDATTHSSGTYQFGARGVGLGLSVARSYVEAHGGSICAESEGRGKGSRFRVRLPLTLVEEWQESLTAKDHQWRE
ncbi:MAG: ATP-binding protein, partial [Candidatus Bathyarchaeia archaeon]